MLRAVVLIAVANAIGGLSYLAQKLALEGLPPIAISLLRTLVAALVLGLWMLHRRASFAGWTRADVGRTALLGILAYAAPLTLGTMGVERSSASNGAILILVEPCAILIFSRLLLGVRLGAVELVSVALGLAGALCVVLEGSSLSGLFEGRHVAGNAMLALHGLLWGLYTPLSKPLTMRHGSTQITLLAMLFGTAALAPAALLERSPWSTGPALWTALGWVLALGLVVSVVSMVLWLEALRELPAPSIAPFVFLQPICGALGGWALLGERLSPAALSGGLLIAAGVLVTLLPAWMRRRRAPAA